MSNSCKWVPSAPNGKDSKLFVELQAHLGDRDAAKKIWAFTKTELFTSEFSDIEKDENGEFTYQAVSDVLNLDSMFTDPQKDLDMAISMGLLTDTRNAASFDLAKAAMDRAAAFNEKAKHRVAIVEEENGKFKTRIVERSLENIAAADRNEARAALNTSLLQLVQKLGFNIEFVDDPTFVGVFNPLYAERNASTLATVIRVANNELGREALPEEVSHLVIAGMKEHPLIQRANATFTDDVVKRVLGNRYKEYYRKYKKGKMLVEDRLREEAQAKVLADILKGRETEGLEEKSPQKNLIRRIWDRAISLFKKASVSDVDNAFVDAQAAMRAVATEMERDDFDTVIDTDLIMKHEAMYELAESLEKKHEIAQEGETLLSQKLSILEGKNGGQDTKALRNEIKQIREAIDKEKYESACYMILMSISEDVKNMMLESTKYGKMYNTSTNLEEIAAEADAVDRMLTLIDGYLPYINTLTGLRRLIRRGEIEMEPRQAESIIKDAQEVEQKLKDLKQEAKQLRFSVLKQLISLYYGINGQKPKSFKESEKHKWVSVEMMLQQAESDIKWWDTRMFSAGDSKSPLINVIHKMIVTQQAKRDNIINKHIMKLQDALEKLHKAGYEDDFVYGRDSEGVATGFFVGAIDRARFERAYAAYVEQVKELDIDDYEKTKLIEKWIENNTEEVEIMYGDPLKNGKRRTEIMPKASIYGNEKFDEGWSAEQKAYYKALMDMKANMDALLPPTMQDLYTVPQVLRSTAQMFDKDGHGALKTVWAKWKQEFSVVKDNLDYGETRPIDFAGNEIKRVPIYYVQMLDDMRNLSTDATHAMCGYITMAVNYSEMSKLSDAMNLLKSHVRDREWFKVVETSAGKQVFNRFRAVARVYERTAGKPIEQANIISAVTEYIDRTLYNETKRPMGKMAITDEKAIDKDALANAVLKLTSWSRMGINILSAMTNVTQGETQMIAEAMSGRYFNMRDLIWSKKEYNRMLIDYLGNFNSVNRHDRMYLLINQFNSSEDFFRDMRDKDFKKSALKRILGRGNIYFLNTMGEHYLHTSGMLNILHHEKVRRLSNPNEEVSLYDVIKEVHDENGWHLELDDDIEFVNGNRAFLSNFNFEDKAIVRKSDRDKLFENLNVYINHINSGMHGGYSEAEKGNINRTYVGRMFTQFRQWMFGMYNKYYAGSYYDAIMGVTADGSYRTIMKFIIGCFHDMKTMSLKMALENNRLSDEEKQNARVAYAHMGIYLTLALLCMLTAGWKDDDDRAARLLAYNLRRLKLETGALSITFFPDFLQNIFTLIQSPAAGIKTLENISQMFDIFTGWQTIQSGRFKGWPKAIKSIWVNTPLYNIQKLIDMDDYSYMFNIFNK